MNNMINPAATNANTTKPNISAPLNGGAGEVSTCIATDRKIYNTQILDTL